MATRMLAASFAVTMLLTGGVANASTLACRSDGGYERCSTNTGDGVVLQRELRGNCVQDRSWGYDPGGIWVDKGCAAEFAVGSSGSDGVGVGTAIGVIGAIAALGAVAAIAAGGDDDNNNSSSNSSKREDNAISLCTDYANKIVKDAGGRGARLDRVKSTRKDGDRWRVEAYMEARWPGTSNPTRFIDCTVTFSGSNRVSQFRHDGLDDRPRGSSGGGSHAHGNNDRDLRETAVLACQNEAKRQDYKVRDVSDIYQHRRGFEMALQLERKQHGARQRFSADCRYDTNNREAQLSHIGRS